MANHKSAIKRAKQNEVRRLRNRARRTRMKNVIKSLEEALRTNPELAQERLRDAISTIDRTAQKGVIHRKKAARKISRLASRVNAILKA